jgi:predicted HNH restriction endonuclease
VTVPVRLSTYFFVQDTVWPLDPLQCHEIKSTYLKKYPRLNKTLAGLFDGLVPHSAPKLNRTISCESDIEGLRIEYRATRAKRSQRLRKTALRRANGQCAVCGRDFSHFLGGRGKRVLQVHHRMQLAASKVPRITALDDLVVVCANCHLLIHLDPRRAYGVDELRGELKNDGYLVT